MNTKTLPPLALIAGPTGSGKSALAMALAATRPSVIINADSMQVYRDLRILTARPSVEDEAAVPHRLFGYIDGALACSAARWADDARIAIDDAHASGRLPILVGGTGLYVRTVLDGIAPVPAIDPDIRANVRALEVDDAYAALMTEDPAAAARMAPADIARIARALEVVRSTGRPLSAWQRGARTGGIAGRITLAPLVLTPPRNILIERCDARFERMFDNGQAEVKALVARSLDSALPVMRAIGVRQIAAFVAATADRETAVQGGKIATRQYVKRQQTWFIWQTPGNWLRINPSSSNDAIKLLNCRLTP